jgi:hypothetical protein
MPTVFRRSNGIYYALFTVSDGHRKNVSTRSRSKLEALEHRPLVCADNRRPSEPPSGTHDGVQNVKLKPK